jgi:formylglycine-generating enzyme required for sulfatase activity
MPNQSSRPRAPTVVLFLLALPTAAACSGGNAASAVVQQPRLPASRCGVVKSQAKPYIVEWQAAERGDLETGLKKGLIAVRYEGCEMEVLDQCRAPGAYVYGGFTRKHDTITMRDADDLYANIPVHAASFEAKLQTSGELHVAMTVVGSYVADRTGVRPEELTGDCARATHVVTAMTAGAFEFFAGADAQVGGGAKAFGAEAGATSHATREMLNQDGDRAACEKAAEDDKKPPKDCGALLRLEVVPLGDPKRTAAVCPDGTTWDGTQCVRTQAVTQIECPPGTQLQGTSCVGSVVPGAAPPPGGAPAAARARAGVTIDGMVSLPGGTFQMGERGDLVTVRPFSLDATEVTVDAYRRCDKCSAPGTGQGCNWGVPGRGSHPVNCVDWDQATAFCATQKKRLPTEEEWEWAARGTTRGTAYPWGNDAPGRQLCWDGVGSDLGKASRSSTCPVGSYASGNSPEGIKDLAGNVWEWTSSPLNARARVNRGGSWRDGNPAGVSAARRDGYDPSNRYGDLGFRCAR